MDNCKKLDISSTHLNQHVKTLQKRSHGSTFQCKVCFNLLNSQNLDFCSEIQHREFFHIPTCHDRVVI